MSQDKPTKEESKKLCSGDGCYNQIDLYFERKKSDGTYHPFALLCGNCISDEQRRTLKNWDKKQRHRINQKLKTPLVAPESPSEGDHKHIPDEESNFSAMGYNVCKICKSIYIVSSEYVPNNKKCEVTQESLCGCGHLKKAHHTPSQVRHADSERCVHCVCKMFLLSSLPKEDEYYHEIERVLTDFKNGATYSDSIEKVQSFISRTRTQVLDEVSEAIGKLYQEPAMIPHGSPYISGVNETVASAQDIINKLRKQ